MRFAFGRLSTAARGPLPVAPVVVRRKTKPAARLRHRGLRRLERVPAEDQDRFAAA